MTFSGMVLIRGEEKREEKKRKKKGLYCQLRARRALSLFNDVLLRTRRVLSLCKVTSDSALLVLNETSVKKAYIVSWEPEGHYHNSMMFLWEPKGRYRSAKSLVIAPFWFSMEHHWTALTPFWFSANDIEKRDFGVGSDRKGDKQMEID